MNQPTRSPAASALSRARNGYLLLGTFFGLFILMIRRKGFRLETVITDENENAFRAVEGALVFVALIGLLVIARWVVRNRAKALGETEATSDLVADDFARIKRLAVIGFGIPSFMGMLMVLAHGWGPVNGFLFFLPVFLLLATLPTESGIKAFARQVNAARPTRLPGGEGESIGAPSALAEGVNAPPPAERNPGEPAG